ncbi:hypothetical protein ACFY4C_03650 [Actinomadura viridis]|uniref:hypothetical protein n=1 Tax=Actinomadura viridis TaxID=58110 RepID=UPI0036BE854E
MPGDLRMRVEETVAEVERCLEDTNVDALRTSTERLAQVSRRMRTAAYARRSGEAGPDTGPGGGA